MKILLVEDDEIDAEILKAWLARADVPDLELTHVTRLAESIALLTEEQFDVVLLDLHLPDACGSDTVARVLEANDQIPIIVLSGRDDEEFAVQTVQQGAQDYLIKGEDDVRSLLRSVRYAIERKRIEGRLQYLADFDSLTGLANRQYFHVQVTKSCARAARSGRPAALLFLDLDRFKQINDRFGHDAGDSLLKQVAERLVDSVRTGDTVARLGGDEFAVVLEGIHDANGAGAAASKILRVMSEPFLLIDQPMPVSPSIGLAMYPEDGPDVDTLLKNADMAMYQAKQKGRNQFQFFTKELNAQVVGRHELERDLRAAISQNQFEVHYQPRVDTRTGDTVALEALIRWNHPAKGLVYPGDFIDFAQEVGLIASIGRRVLETACRQQRTWQDRGLRAVPTSVNVSASEFHRPGFAAEIRGVLEATGLEPRLLELEVTEGVLMEDTESSQRNLVGLKALGVRILMDDFGTGYSSLSYLRKFPVDGLKIDRSFVQHVVDDHSTQAIVKTIVSLADNLNMGVTAEGVETPAQLEFLRMCGCEHAQGYFFGRPASANDTARLLGGSNIGEPAEGQNRGLSPQPRQLIQGRTAAC